MLLEKLTGFQLVKTFPAFCGIPRFITAFTSARHLSLSWASSTQSIPPYPTSWRFILILSSHLRLGLPSGLFPSDLSIVKYLRGTKGPERWICCCPHVKGWSGTYSTGTDRNSYSQPRVELCTYAHPILAFCHCRWCAIKTVGIQRRPQVRKQEDRKGLRHTESHNPTHR